MPSRLAIEKAAQAWCTPTTEKITMIPELAMAFADILDELGISGEVVQEPECAYCGASLEDIKNAVYLDESGVDGVFCDDACAGAFIQCTVELVADEGAE